MVQREVMAALRRRQNGHNRAAWFTLRDLGLLRAESSASRERSVRRAVDELVRSGHIEKAYAAVSAESAWRPAERAEPVQRSRRRHVLCIRQVCTTDDETELAEWQSYQQGHAGAFEAIDPDAERTLAAWAALETFSGVQPTALAFRSHK